ncbi:MAG: histone H1-like repetitive region-containing protein [Desulfobacterales bacterium]
MTKPTRKDLIRKQFDLAESGPVWTPPAVEAPSGAYEAPSFFAGMSDADIKRGKALLKAKFDYGEIKVAGERYAKEKAAAEKAAAEKAAAEKAAAEKAAAEKAAAEKAAAEKAAAEKAAAEKAAAEKAAAEKAAAEKAAAEKAAAEKAAAEKAAAEKATAEKAAAEKAAAEKAAAQKAAAEKNAREASASVPPSTTIQVLPENSESGFNVVKIGIIAVVAVILLLIVYSYNNAGKYYFTEENGTVEIWRGVFAPMGKTRVISMTGVELPFEENAVYGWKDAYALMYGYYINQADALLEGPGVPDAAALKENLELAVKYAPNRELRDAARDRVVSLDLQIEIQRAAAAVNRGTIESVQNGIAILRRATAMGASDAEVQMLEQKIAQAEAQLAGLEAEQAESDRLAAESAALEAEEESLEEAAGNPAAPEGESR